jgi:glutathione S-transferase
MNKPTYIHYGAEVSLFSGKTRAYLRYKGIPFEEHKASAKVVRELLYPNTGVRVIPVLKTPENEFVQDTTEIIDYLEQRFTDSSVYPKNPSVKLAALLLELFADEWLLLPAMHYRWFYKKRHLWFVLKEFGANGVPHWPKFIQPLFGVLPALYFGKMFGPVLGVSKRNYKAIELWYESFLSQLDMHFQKYDFLLGNSPCIADFGFIGPLYAHLYRDPYSGELMRSKAPNVALWVERMNQLSPEQANLGFVDSVPSTLTPIFERMFKEQFPVLKETVERVASRISTHPTAKLPRFLGKFEFSIGNSKETRLINSYAQWMLQRPVNFYQSLDTQHLQAVNGWLQSVGGQESMNIKITTQLIRKRNLLYPKKT